MLITYGVLQIDTFLQQIGQKKVGNAPPKPIVKACKDVIGSTVLLNGKFPGVSTKGNPGVFDGTKRPIVELAENLSGDDRLLNGQSEMVFLAENLNGIKLQVGCGCTELHLQRSNSLACLSSRVGQMLYCGSMCNAGHRQQSMRANQFLTADLQSKEPEWYQDTRNTAKDSRRGYTGGSGV